MTEEEIVRFVTGLLGVVAVVASNANKAPKVSWCDTFFLTTTTGTTCRPGGSRSRPPSTRTTPLRHGPPARTGVFRFNVSVNKRTFPGASDVQ